MTQKEHIGFDCIDRIKDILVGLKPKRIFLVTGNKSYIVSGAKAIVDKLLKDYSVTRFSDYSANPKSEDVQRGIDQFTKGDYDTVIAVGGGSAIDIAKLINFLSVRPKDFKAYDFSSTLSGQPVRPLIAIPTTAGSGSEATKFAVLYVNKTKYSIDDELVLPAFSLVDPGLTMSLPGYITAVSGMDALSQAVESYWSVNSTDESKEYAAQAIKLAMSNLETAVIAPDKTSRLNMSTAANLAGKAINITRTTASHAISYPLTSHFGIAHGQAVGITLASMLLYNSEVTEEDLLDKRGVFYVRKMTEDLCHLLGAKSPSEAAKAINRLMCKIELKVQLHQFGITNSESLERIVSNGLNLDRVKNNPRKLTSQSLRRILQSIL